MTELATWDRPKEELVDRCGRPWDDAERRPSHSDRRNFLRRAIVLQELNTAMDWNFIPTKIIALLKRAMRLAISSSQTVNDIIFCHGCHGFSRIICIGNRTFF